MQECSQVGRMLLEEPRQSNQVRDFRLPHSVGDQSRRDIDAIEYVADVVQHAGGDLRHASPVRRVHQHLMGFLQVMLRSQSLGNFSTEILIRKRQFGRALLDLDFEIIVCSLNGSFTLLNLLQHGVKLVVQHAQLVVRALVDTDSVISIGGNRLGRRGQFQDWAWRSSVESRRQQD